MASFTPDVSVFSIDDDKRGNSRNDLVNTLYNSNSKAGNKHHSLYGLG